ncbi:MAG: diguanylate cyclase [Nocardioidaceae bacterium]|nr:diguanylate cyclase [Nocardioidaceae bacterium]
MTSTEVEVPDSDTSPGGTLDATDHPGLHTDVENSSGAKLFAACLSGDTIRHACGGLTDDLLAAGIELPSVYLLVGDRLRCFAARGYFQVVDGFPRTAGVIGSVVASGVPVWIPDVREREDFIAAVPNLLGEACVPIVMDGQVVGAVNAESVGLLSPTSLPLLQRAAAALATRIAQLGGMPQESLMQRVARAAVELYSLEDPAALESQAIALAMELSEMSSAILARRSATELIVTAGGGPLRDDLAMFTAAELETIAQWVSEGTSSHFSGLGAPPAYDFLDRAGLRSLAVYPLIAGGEHTGLLITADTEPQAHLTNIVEALELVAAQVATGLSALEAFQEMRRRAATDPLTGVGNFRAFVGDLSAALEEASDRLVTCVLLDVDHFKAVNDSRGHLVGDRLLQDVVAVLCRTVGAGDKVYRLGGDELAVIASCGDQQGATRLAQRLLTAVRTTGATASAGFACATGAVPSDLRAQADKALYAAKRAVRDTVRSSDDTLPVDWLEPS